MTIEDPLVPPSCDLRDFAFMPLEVDRLRRSKQWLVAKRRPEIGFYSMNLWAASWHEVPAGSLEDDDDVLADLAMCDVRRWPKVKEDTLRGWRKCSDGRLYHPVVCEKARESWRAKLEQRQRTDAARLAKLRKRLDATDDEVERARLRKIVTDVERSLSERATESVANNVTRSVTKSVATSVTDNVTDSKGQGQGQGQGQKERAESARGARLPADWVLPPEWRTAAEQARRDAGLPPCNLDLEAASFRDFWIAKPGAGGVKLDWRATWLNWARRANSRPAQGSLPMNGTHPPAAALTKSGAPPSKNIRVGSAEDIAERLEMGIITEEMAAEERARLPR